MRGECSIPAVVGALALLCILVVPNQGAAGPAAPRPITLVGSCTAGGTPGMFGIAYDPSNRFVYVPDEPGGRVTILNSSCGLVKSVSLGNPVPMSAVYDPANGYVYVGCDRVATKGNADPVYVLDNTSVIATLNGPYDGAEFMAYDPAAGLMIVANDHTNNLTAINGTSTTSLFTGVGATPIAIAYDPMANVLVVANLGNGTVAANLTLINASAPFGPSPHRSVPNISAENLAFDPNDGRDYASSGSTVWELRGNGSVVAMRHLSHGSYSGGPGGLLYDPPKRQMLVSDGNTVWAIKGNRTISRFTLTSFPPITGALLEKMAYDRFNHLVYVVGYASGRTYELT